MKNVISGVLNKAVDDEASRRTLPTNSGRFSRLRTKEGRRFPHQRGTQEALRHGAGALSPALSLFLLLARTGLRIGEALALQWGDIDFNGRFITIQREFREAESRPPKTAKAEESI